MTDKEILMRLLRSLTLADNLGDVFESARQAAKLADIPVPYGSSFEDWANDDWLSGNNLWAYHGEDDDD